MKAFNQKGRAAMRGIYLGTALLIVSGTALANQPYIDHAQEKQQLDRKDKIKKSCPAVPFAKYSACAKKITEDWSQAHPLRGSDEYCEAAYRKLTEAEAKAKVDELKKLALSARSTSAKKEPGEVWSGDFENEANWIRVKVLHVKLLETRVFK